MKVTEEYLENALAFEQLAAVEIDPTLKDDFAKQAAAFRKLNIVTTHRDLMWQGGCRRGAERRLQIV